MRFASELVTRHSLFVTTLLLLAFVLRVWNLIGVPPGLTHDEANHSREAIGILNGVLRYFFPLNYGSEPLYSYTVALSMALFGRGVFALRLVNVVFGVLAVAATYGWAASRLGRPVALLGAALLAVSFWPLASSREALRAGMLPFFFVLATWAFWRIMEESHAKLARDDRTGKGENASRALRPWRSLREVFTPAVLLFGVAITATLHTYLAARVSWLLFPLFLGYLALAHRSVFRRAWGPALAGLLLGGLLAAPLFLYLRAHPEMQTRLDMLDGPLQAIAAGQWRPVLANVRDALLAFVWPGRGDQFLAYNIPGRPVFDAVSAVFFLLGLLVCLRRWRQPAYAFLLLWFLVGIAPSLVTGPTANTTRNLAALPAAFLMPAVGFFALTSRLTNEPPLFPLVTRRSSLVTLLAVLWLSFAAVVSARDYFGRWAPMPEVRGAYQATLVAAVNHVLAAYPDADPVVFSSIYPGAAHDPSIALVLAADRPAVGWNARWVDARWALALPPGVSLVVVPASTPPHEALAPWLEPLETVAMRPNDLDQSFTVYRLDGERAAAGLIGVGTSASVAADAVKVANFNGAAELLAARWLSSGVSPGQTAELLTVWRVLAPTRAGPAAPPTFATDAVLFSHVLDGAGGVLAQRDSLDAPSWAWRAGEVFVQLHPLAVPNATAPGEYAAVVGFYDHATGVRLPVLGGGDTAPVPALVVLEE